MRRLLVLQEQAAQKYKVLQGAHWSVFMGPMQNEDFAPDWVYMGSNLIVLTRFEP